MATRFNEVNHSFIVQISTASGAHHDYMRIDQNAGNIRHARNVMQVSNAVQRYLHKLGKTTGMVYHVIYEGNPEMATAILEGENDCPF